MSDKPDSTPEKSEHNKANDKTEKSALTIAVSKNTKILALFAIACTVAVGLVNELTKDRIKKQEQQHLLRTLHSIIEPSRYDNDIANDCIVMSAPELGVNKVHTAYIARKSGKVIAVAMTSTAPKGYNGNIDFIMAINNDGSVSGVRVLKHKETPGLGDKIELRKSDWVTSFTGKKLLSEDDSRWAVSKDNGMFDQFTGATITPRAVVEGVKNTLNYFTNNKASLLTRPNACGDVLITSAVTDTPPTTPSSNQQSNQTANQTATPIKQEAANGQ